MKHTIALALALAALLSTGCVERRMIIRSEPALADVYVDHEYVGQTPLDLEFAHYGTRHIRVGPVRQIERTEDGELISDSLLYEEKSIEVAIEAPWYETFPIDFFAEVLWPGTLYDRHEIPLFKLEPALQTESRTDEERARESAESRRRAEEEVLVRAQQLRREALDTGGAAAE